MRLRLGRIAWILSVGLVLGGIVHLVSILALPRLATRNADALLEPLAGRHEVVLLDRDMAGAGGTIPYRDPASAVAVCRFDLSNGPVRVRANAGNAFMAIAFHTPEGGVFYALTDRSAARGSMEALVVTQAQLDVLLANDPEDEPVRELRLVSPRRTGFVTFRTLALEPGLLAEAEGQLKTARCAPEAQASLAP